MNRNPFNYELGMSMMAIVTVTAKAKAMKIIIWFLI